MISWNFPGNQDGQVKGVADAGIENFNGTELSSGADLADTFDLTKPDIPFYLPETRSGNAKENEARLQPD